MVGPGTGLAPFRGFLQERAALKARGVNVGPSLLFFGCRHEQQDFIYEDELRAFAGMGVTELHLAFSRMQPEKVYVQDAIRNARDRVRSLIEDGAVIYVCGDASRMKPDVRKALTGILQDTSGADPSDAADRFTQLVAANRYRVDVWASN